MKRPFLLRMLPERLRTSVWARCYRGKHAAWKSLYSSAELAHAPRVQMQLMPGDVISDSIAFTGIFELSVTRRVVHQAQLGGTLIDIGANLGYFALLWAAARPENRCIAFEASPRNLEILQRNIERNGFTSQIKVIPHAAGKSPGKLKFNLGPADQTGWGGFAATDSTGDIDVDVLRVDDVVSPETRVKLLKVDTEGADAWAIMGCERLLKAGAVEEIWFEQNKPRMQALGVPEDAAQEYLRSLGFRVRSTGDTSADIVEWSAVPAH